MTTSKTKLKPRGKIFLVKSWTEIMTSEPLIENTVIFKRQGVANFADIIKLQLRLSKEPLKTQIKLKALSKCNLYIYFLISQKFLIFGEKILMSAELKE